MSASLRSLVVTGALVGFALPLWAVPAEAGSLGGFSEDESVYLDGRDQVCTPIVVSAGETGPAGAAPACEQADARRVASLRFRRGVRQQGTRADYSARFRGTEIAIESRREQRVIITWSALDPIERIVSVHTSARGRLLAVEYEVRFGGRARTDVVAFVVPGAGAGGAQSPSEPGDPDPSSRSSEPQGTDAPDAAGEPGTTAPTGTTGDETRPGLEPALTKARRADRRGARAAERAWRAVLAIDPEHAEARYGLAKQLARQGRRAPAVEALAALATAAAAGRGEAVEWLVEARFERAFASLRGDPGFRAATGLDRAPGAPRPLYERLLGFSDTWEQAEVKCEQAEVKLAIARRDKGFRLVITSRCGGAPTRTRLRGQVRLGADARVDLVMPNRDGDDDVVACRMDTCDDEDCLRCAVDRDLSFTLLPVRR